MPVDIIQIYLRVAIAQVEGRIIELPDLSVELDDLCVSNGSHFGERFGDGSDDVFREAHAPVVRCMSWRDVWGNEKYWVGC